MQGNGPCRLCYFFDPFPGGSMGRNLCCLHVRTTDKEATCERFKYKRQTAPPSDARAALSGGE